MDSATPHARHGGFSPPAHDPLCNHALRHRDPWLVPMPLVVSDVWVAAIPLFRVLKRPPHPLFLLLPPSPHLSRVTIILAHETEVSISHALL